MTQLSIQQLLDLSGKSAIVTGGAMGIGEAIAARLAEAGAQVMISDINAEAGEKAAAALKTRGLKAEFVKTDAGAVKDIQHAVDQTVDRFGGLDILVNNAGIFPFAPLSAITEELWDKVQEINTKGYFFFAQLAAKAMVEQGKGGRIINIASIDALHPTGNLIHYDTSKGGVAMMTKSLALELGPQGILVNAIAPGGITTAGAASTGASMMAAAKLTPEQIKAISENFTQRIPLRRQGYPDEIARATLFLASPMADYMTGSLMVVDGGYLLS
jgi:NAD(P)-dependent dehydrogenase (short-subunit alcohol dehydrogenase family)